jgi:hypothetical protein
MVGLTSSEHTLISGQSPDRRRPEADGTIPDFVLSMGHKRLMAMSQVREAIARLTQVRDLLAPITERLSDIETYLSITGPRPRLARC